MGIPVAFDHLVECVGLILELASLRDRIPSMGEYRAMVDMLGEPLRTVCTGIIHGERSVADLSSGELQGISRALLLRGHMCVGRYMNGGDLCLHGNDPRLVESLYAASTYRKVTNPLFWQHVEPTLVQDVVDFIFVGPLHPPRGWDWAPFWDRLFGNGVGHVKLHWPALWECLCPNDQRRAVQNVRPMGIGPIQERCIWKCMGATEKKQAMLLAHPADWAVMGGMCDLPGD